MDDGVNSRLGSRTQEREGLVRPRPPGEMDVDQAERQSLSCQIRAFRAAANVVHAR
jgi:hypothetical protein